MNKIVIVGAGINGVTAAIALKKRGHNVTLIDPGPLPQPLAASTDISKAVRSTYGSDEDYTVMAERSVELWRQWNQEFGVELYHETGMMFVRREPMQPGDFEYESLTVADRREGRLSRLDQRTIEEKFPAWIGTHYLDGVMEREAGYVESGLAVSTLAHHAREIGIELFENSRFAQLAQNGNTVTGVVLADGTTISADKVLMTTGAWTPYLLPFTKGFFRATGHAVFHFKPLDLRLFVP